MPSPRDHEAQRTEKLKQVLATDDREGKLPKWAQDKLRELRYWIEQAERKLARIETKAEEENGELADLWADIELALQSSDWSKVAGKYRERYQGE